ncbi:phosphodiester glycosidase family protein [Microcoleus sp. FACHB-1515]|uniref:phosphodiester glycosidase family protein n=1 Tax=Cyanophyceae TaxID=3028117 RepID=UPI00168463F7|nr:phosphodiester glycosidase family protein [Microcoleus sp. FACHB-1515]MBD2090467.1 phosphodiester glycosidase family protein [Microcoleus sp. FACHB-1515]
MKYKMAAIAALLLPFVLYAVLCWQRPPQTNEVRFLFPGIAYQREFRRDPRPMMIHIVSIDLTTPGLRVFVTPGNPTPDRTETIAQTTAEFLREFDLQLAVNASFFFPFREETPWDFYPHSGDRVNTIGKSIAQGNSYSVREPGWPVLCFASDRAQIVEANCPPNTTEAVAGSEILLAQGRSIVADSTQPDPPYARTVVAIAPSSQQIWLIAIDGKQPLYSEGATLAEVASIALGLGANSAINLDGGGSTTLAVRTNQKVTILNAPIHTKLPMRQRPIANHIGFAVRSNGS